MECEPGYTGPLIGFDLDDTLYKELDFLKSGFQAVAHYVSNDTGIDPLIIFEKMISSRESGHNAFDMLADLYYSADRDVFISKAVDIYRFHLPQLSASKEAIDLLTALTNRGIRLALVTDGRSRTQRAKLSALGMTRFFHPDNILISEETGTNKLNIKPWKTLVRRYPNASRFIYIGDNPAKDFIIPHKLGWTTIGILDSGHNIHKQYPIPEDSYAPNIWVKDLQSLYQELAILIHKTN